MRKHILSILTSIALVFAFTSTSNAETGVGVTLNLSSIETSGSETLRNSAKVTNADHEENVALPEFFIENITDTGAIGVAFIPVQELGTKSRSDTNSEGDTGSYKADAEVEDLLMVYADFNLTETAGHTVYGKIGFAHASIITNESLNSGSTYGDQDVLGGIIGIGAKADFGGNYYYKLEATYTDFEEYSDTGSGGSNISADVEVMSAKVSVGYKF